MAQVPAKKKLQQNIIKIVFVGNTGVGKTCFIQKLCDNKFSHNMTSTASNNEFRNYNMVVDNQEFNLRLWDTAGQEKYRSLAKINYQLAKGIFLLCSVEQDDPVKYLRNWIGEIKTNAPEDVVIIVCMTKCDKDKSE